MNTIKAAALDKVLNHSKVDLIEMDIEGSEPFALEGAKNIIQRYHPKLTICAYHYYEHYFQLPLQIMKTDSSYKLHFRTHTVRDQESVIYAV